MSFDGKPAPKFETKPNIKTAAEETKESKADDRSKDVVPGKLTDKSLSKTVTEPDSTVPGKLADKP